jgi:myo-inositol catabolism protein IolC
MGTGLRSSGSDIRRRRQVEELIVLREHRKQLMKLIAELKAENRRVRKKLERGLPHGH